MIRTGIIYERYHLEQRRASVSQYSGRKIFSLKLRSSHARAATQLSMGGGPTSHSSSCMVPKRTRLTKPRSYILACTSTDMFLSTKDTSAVVRSRNFVEAHLVETQLVETHIVITQPGKLRVMVRSCVHYGVYGFMNYTGRRLPAPGHSTRVNRDDSTTIMFQVGRTIKKAVVAPKSTPPPRSCHSHNSVTFGFRKAPSVASGGQISRGSGVAIGPSMLYRPLVLVQVVCTSGRALSRPINTPRACSSSRPCVRYGGGGYVAFR